MSGALLLLGLLLVAPSEPDAASSDLTPEARIHHQRGLAALDAGEFAASVDELERAYALVPDPLLHRDGRSKVMGSLRAALTEAHAATGERAHLERLQALLLAHSEALRRALEPTGTPEDFVMIEAALRQVEALLGRSETAPAESAEPVASPAAPSPAQPAPPSDRSRRPPLRIAGGVLMGLGTAALGVMAYGIVVHVDNHRKLQSLTRTVAAGQEPPTPAQNREAGGYHERSHNHRSLAAVTGALGGAALVTGIALHMFGTRPTRSRLGLALGPRSAGLTWRLQF